MLFSLHPTDLLIASGATALFVGPLAYHLLDDIRTRPTRDFSLIPHRLRHALRAALTLGLILAGAALSTQANDTHVSHLIWFVTISLMVGMSMVGVTDRRLSIEANTGLVRWRRISWPWPSGRRNATFIDKVSSIHFNGSNRRMDLLGLASLEEYYTVNYNGSISSSGHYSSDTLHGISDQVNAYLDAFRRHDTAPQRESRARYRKQVESARAPRKERAAQKRLRKEQRLLAAKAKLAEEIRARQARANQSRHQRLEEKFL